MKIQGKYTTIDIKTDEIEQTAFKQLLDISNQKLYQNTNIKVMPDVHAGVGCTIGFTMPITDFVIPNLIGVDIGCGVNAHKLYLKEEDIDFQALDDFIKENIAPRVLSNSNKSPYLDGLIYKPDNNLDYFRNQIGTLGGGNHFIAIERDNHGIWLVIHTGSRNLGTRIAKHYQSINDVLTGQDMKDYIHDMQLAQHYASNNRYHIASKIITFLKDKGALMMPIESVHNYIGSDNIIRKGAISAYQDKRIVIPLNMKDGSILGVGRGNADWNFSAPHGAGRMMSRGQAKRELDLNEFQNQMQGIFSTSVNNATLDEAPNAYKSKAHIINSIEDTVIITNHIRPIYNFKN